MPAALPPLAPLDLAFLAGVLLLIYLSRRWVLLYALLAWPGTALHELAHWVVALLLGGRPTAPTLVPERSERGWRLGSVGIRAVRWFNALPIAMAPLLLAPLAAYALVQGAAVDANHWLHWAGLYVAAAAAVSCVPSLADAKIALSRPLGIVFYVALAAGAWWFWLQR